MAPRKLLTVDQMTGEMEKFISLTGLSAIIPDPGAAAAVMTAFGLALQDIDAGPAKDCSCDPCVTLRQSLATIERLIDEFFG